MFKLYKGNKSGKSTNATTHSNRDSHGSEGGPHRAGKQRDLILTNILEEGSSVDEPRSFEQDEQYLNECLKALDGNPEALQVEEGNLEEYDFDDYNSIASTASLLNIHAELAQDHINPVTRNHTPSPTNQNAAFQASQPNGTVRKDTVINGTDTGNSPTDLREQLLRMSKVQASISKVKNWSKFGISNGDLSKDEWKDVFLEAAQEGDLKKVQEAYRKLGGTSELTIRITDSLANTALHKASEAGNLPCLQWLVGRLPNDCLRNITNHDNLTPLAAAVKNGSMQRVQWLLEDTSAADEMSDDNSRFALIHLTIQNGQDDCLKCLLAYIRDKYLELDVTDSSGVTLAHVAAREGHLTCLQTLVDHNIDVSTEDKDGRSPADYAYAAGQTGCGRYLVMEESCWLLSMRIAKLHRELKDCKDENKELRQRLEVLESRARCGMPDRPEAVGGDQSDTSSTGATKSDEKLGTKLTDSPCSDRSRASGSPDGESPKGFGHERSAYHYHVNGNDHSFERRPLPNRLSSNGITIVNKETEVKSARHFEALKQQRRMEARGSIDSTGSGVSSPMSWSDTTTDNSVMQNAMAKQIAANTRRLVMSKHAQKVEESPLIRSKLKSVVIDGLPVDEPRKKGPHLQVIRPDIYYSPSSSCSHSPARTDSTSGSRPTSGTPREDWNVINKLKTNRTKEEKRTIDEDRAGTPARIRSFANRRKTSSFSSDSTPSSDSDVERSGQRNNGPRHRGYPTSNRTKEHSGNAVISRQNMPRQVSGGDSRAKKNVSWNESLKATTPINLKRQTPVEKPRVPPKPPVRTVSRDSNVVRTMSRDGGALRTMLRDSDALRKESRETSTLKYLQVPRNPTPNGVNKSVQQPVKSMEENSGIESSFYSFDGYQQDDRPWYETDEFD